MHHAFPPEYYDLSKVRPTRCGLPLFDPLFFYQRSRDDDVRRAVSYLIGVSCSARTVNPEQRSCKESRRYRGSRIPQNSERNNSGPVWRAFRRRPLKTGIKNYQAYKNLNFIAQKYLHVDRVPTCTPGALQSPFSRGRFETVVQSLALIIRSHTKLTWSDGRFALGIAVATITSPTDGMGADRRHRILFEIRIWSRVPWKPPM